MKSKRIWRGVRHSYVSRLGYGRVWRCVLACGHECWRPVKHQPSAPKMLVCRECERQEVEASRPQWQRDLLASGNVFCTQCGVWVGADHSCKAAAA